VPTSGTGLYRNGTTLFKTDEKKEARGWGKKKFASNWSKRGEVYNFTCKDLKRKNGRRRKKKRKNRGYP